MHLYVACLLWVRKHLEQQAGDQDQERAIVAAQAVLGVLEAMKRLLGLPADWTTSQLALNLDTWTQVSVYVKYMHPSGILQIASTL